ncbi:hypothetical protein KP509_08G037900 [Ceratopteris richardii]|uniref:Uncharacterized protein n=1 Tax=Ceratopteris richardii TaxID=49495 RepID=A0A8T2U600_CERRI|nr:hypothetical protein KP509_08G037900 [Ceratopteris richardii]
MQDYPDAFSIMESQIWMRWRDKHRRDDLDRHRVIMTMRMRKIRMIMILLMMTMMMIRILVDYDIGLY